MIEDRESGRHGAEQFRRYVDGWNAIGERVQLRIVGCGKLKAAERRPAMELYTGDLSAKRIEIADDLAPAAGASPFDGGSPFLILSAKHGLVGPLAELDPYDATIDSVDRDELVERVRRQIMSIGADRLCITAEAGSKYVGIIEDAISDHPDARVSPGRVVGSVCRAKAAGRRILDWHEAMSRRTAA